MINVLQSKRQKGRKKLFLILDKDIIILTFYFEGGKMSGFKDLRGQFTGFLKILRGVK